MKTILVVEHFIPVQNLLRDTLESNGYLTYGAVDGTRAFEILINQPYKIDLIITDYHMPNGSGYDLLRSMKRNQELARLPVIFLTAESNPELVTNIERLGCTGWIKKPYRANVLLNEVVKALVCNKVTEAGMLQNFLAQSAC